MALLTWLGAYPVITIALGVLGPITTAWPLPLRTLLISGLMVAALTWGVLPALTYALRGWLRGNH
jgi:antibiotic biosynthesis monooxygenase (ABM) superfamily enzyme